MSINIIEAFVTQNKCYQAGAPLATGSILTTMWHCPTKAAHWTQTSTMSVCQYGTAQSKITN